MHRRAHEHMKVELTQTQMNTVERIHADVERRILLAQQVVRLYNSVINEDKEILNIQFSSL